jgi:hypothetical protein
VASETKRIEPTLFPVPTLFSAHCNSLDGACAA